MSRRPLSRLEQAGLNDWQVIGTISIELYTISGSRLYDLLFRQYIRYSQQGCRSVLLYPELLCYRDTS